jgi:PAS domain S-box-containing protein
MTVQGTYDPLLVALSYVVAVIASYAALDLAGRVSASQGRARQLWLGGGAVAMGLGIWTMHFTGMLALDLAMPMLYNIVLVIVSFLIAIAASGFALVIASRPTLGVRALLISGVCLGLGIATMHYTGMAAMDIDGVIQYHPAIVGASLVIAIGASVAALWLAFRLRSTQGSPALWIARKVGSATVMGAAITGMHYTGMAAATFTTHHVARPLSALDTNNVTLGIALSVTTLVILGIALICALIDRRFSTQTASFESLFLHSTDAIFAFDQDGSLKRSNPAAARLTGYPLGQLSTRSLEKLLAPADQVRLVAELRDTAQGMPQHGEYAIMQQAGQTVIGQTTMVPIIVGEQITGVYMIVRDVSSRRRAEDALRGQRDLY